MSSFTSNKGYSAQSAGSNSGVWGAGNAGVDLNTGVISIVDSNMAGITSLSLASTTPVNLTATQCQNAMLSLTGALLADITISNNSNLMVGFYYFENLTTGNFSVTLSNGVGTPLVLPQSQRGVLFIDGTNGPRMIATFGATAQYPLPAGTVSAFYQNAAPTFWTISAALNDYGVRIVSSAGGVTSGATAYSTWNAQTVTGSHTLSIAEMPAHTHSQSGTSSGGTNTPGGAQLFPLSGTSNTGSTGGGGGHTHTLTQNILTADFILASKN